MSHRSPVTASANTAKKVIGVAVFAPIILAGLALAIPLALLSPFLPKRRMSAQEVARAIRDFLDDTGGEWDWDDFTSNSIADPELDAIARRAGEVPLPLDRDGEIELRALLARAEAMSGV